METDTTVDWGGSLISDQHATAVVSWHVQKVAVRTDDLAGEDQYLFCTDPNTIFYPGTEQTTMNSFVPLHRVPRSLQSWVSTIHTVVLTADVFQLFIKK